MVACCRLQASRLKWYLCVVVGVAGLLSVYDVLCGSAFGGLTPGYNEELRRLGAAAKITLRAPSAGLTPEQHHVNMGWRPGFPQLNGTPTNLTSSYDGLCDLHSPDFMLGNKPVLAKRDFKMFGRASLVGYVLFAWKAFELGFTVLTRPVPAIPILWTWHEIGSATSYTNTRFDHLRDPTLQIIGPAVPLALSPPGLSAITKTYVGIKLRDAAKKFGLILPWSARFQMLIFIGQSCQCVVSSWQRILFAYPHFWWYLNSWEHFFITFRLQASLEMAYHLTRLLATYVTIRQWVGDGRLDWSAYPWGSSSRGVRFAIFLGSFNQYVIPFTALLVALPFIPVFAFGLLPGALVISPWLWRLVFDSSARFSFTSGAAYRKLEEDGDASAVNDMRAESPIHELWSQQKIILVLAGLLSVIWFSLTSIWLKSKLTESTYMCSFSKVGLLVLDLDSVGIYCMVVFVVTLSLSLFSLIMKCIGNEVDAFWSELTHYLWVTYSLRVAPDLSQREELLRALLVTWWDGPFLSDKEDMGSRNALGKFYFLPKKLNGKSVLVEEADGRFLVDKSQTDPEFWTTYGLYYTRTKDINDRVGIDACAIWGSFVIGTDEGDGWVKVQTTKVPLMDGRPIPEVAVPLLEARMADENMKVRIAVGSALAQYIAQVCPLHDGGSCRKDAVGKYVDLLENSSCRVQSVAAIILGEAARIGVSVPDRGLQKLVELSDVVEQDLGASAMTAIGSLVIAGAVVPDGFITKLDTALQSGMGRQVKTHANLRKAAASTLGQLAVAGEQIHQDLLSELAKVASDRVTDVRIEATKALGRIAEESDQEVPDEIINALVSRLSDNSCTDAATKSLGQIAAPKPWQQQWLNESKQKPSTDELRDEATNMIQSIICQAISGGAPIYNEGFSEMCMEFYGRTSELLLEFARPWLKKSVQKQLQLAIDGLREIQENVGALDDAQIEEKLDELAWAFRKGFDNQLGQQHSRHGEVESADEDDED